MTYKYVVERISHWHEHEIHDRISEVLGYDTWKLGTAQVHPTREIDEEIDLTLEFPSQTDFERCYETISEVRHLKRD